MARDERSRDAKSAWIRALSRTAPIERNPGRSFPSVIQEQAEARGDAIAIESPEASLSYAALAALAHRHSHWGLRRGVHPGNVVALQMPNRADYLATWIGLVRIGAVVALVGPKLRGDLLVHAVDASGASHLITAPESAQAVASVRDRFARRPACWVAGGSTAGLDPLDLEPLPAVPISATDRAFPTLDQTALLIYTSGTTGLPKAARVSHHRVMQWSHWFAGLMDSSPADRLFDCLPLHHSVGGVVATGSMLVGGGTVILRPQFSASDFWRDVRESRATVFQYIGELCRYLVQSAPAETPPHSLRLACGNGLRPEVWTAFRDRFRIPHILEYYAATEGNFSLVNCEEEPGSIGRVPSFLGHRTGIALVKFDTEAGQPLRNAEGFCERCEAGEAGAALGWIPPSDGERTGRFEGYIDREASERKILREVFQAGDAWYQTGDLMRQDARGFYYFVDRIGATYRWKGENVSTAEVTGQLGQCSEVLDAVAYGVQVPGSDGRAGMAALVVGEAFDLGRFHAELEERLPIHARPVFLRIMESMPTTETHKTQAGSLAAFGFDPSKGTGPVYLRGAGSYEKMDEALFAEVQRGARRL